MRTVLGIVALSSLLGLAGACGSSSSGGSGIAAMSDANLGALCDQLAGIEGGYSKEKDLSCSDDAGSTVDVMLTFNIGANQAACKTQFKMLPAACASLTTGEVVACVTDTYAQTCADSSSANPPSCDALVACAQ
jgi:hypothetical protein